MIAVAFEEDREIITAQNRQLELDPDFTMLPLAIDSALSQFRWLVDKYVAEERKEKSNVA